MVIPPAGASSGKETTWQKEAGSAKVRRKKMEGVVYTVSGIDAEVWEAIPSPKVEYVRQAVAEKLERDGVEERR